METTLALYRDQTLLFESAGKWLHPLFELEAFLASSGLAPDGLRVRDKIVGKAAALLLVRLGLRQLEAGVLSERALRVLERWSVRYTFGTRVERIACRTEELLENVDDPAEAYRVTCRLAAKEKRSNPS